MLAAVALAAGGAAAATKTARKRAISASIKALSAYLGNTQAVCRGSYIEPRMFDRYHSGSTVGAAIDQAGGDDDLSNERTRTRVEAAVLDLIADQKSPALARGPR